MRLEALTDPPAGSATFSVTDAAARRVPLLPDEPGTAPADVARQRKKAKSTSLAFYTLYLADFAIDRDELTGPGFGLIEPTKGGTIGALTITPSRATGFEVGDVITGTTKKEYKTISSGLPITLTVMSEQHKNPDAFTDITGQVTVLHLTDDAICLDVSIEVNNSGAVVGAAKGVIAAPVLRSDESFYLR